MGVLRAVAEIRAGEALKKGLQEGPRTGLTKALTVAKTQVVRRLLAEKGFTVKKIADIVDVSVAFVEKVKKTNK